MADGSSRFAAQNATAEDLLKSHTVGLVNLADFRKRRAEALDVKGRDAQSGTSSGADTPSERASTPQPAKKKKKVIAKPKISFNLDDDDQDDSDVSAVIKSRSRTGTPAGLPSTATDAATPRSATEDEEAPVRRKLKPNSALGNAPRLMTKSAQVKDAEMREKLRKEFLVMQEAVKATDILIPFVFYDGTNIPGGVCRIKKGEHVWLFLDKSRKVGAELGVGGGDKSKKEWARVGVDDLMLVRGEIIIPHHYEFYYFLVNKSLGFNGPLFSYSAQPTAGTPKHLLNGDAEPDLKTYNPLAKGGKNAPAAPLVDAALLEGANDDPTLTKVVDRRWYEKNKHIYPASIWEEFDPTKDYTKGIRKDTSGNAFFFG